jgi:hypothetical protein
MSEYSFLICLFLGDLHKDLAVLGFEALFVLAL